MIPQGRRPDAALSPQGARPTRPADTLAAQRLHGGAPAIEVRSESHPFGTFNQFSVDAR